MNSKSRFVFVAALVVLAVFSGCATTKSVVAEPFKHCVRPSGWIDVIPADRACDAGLPTEPVPPVAPASSKQRIWEGYFLLSEDGGMPVVVALFTRDGFNLYDVLRDHERSERATITPFSDGWRATVNSIGLFTALRMEHGRLLAEMNLRPYLEATVLIFVDESQSLAMQCTAGVCGRLYHVVIKDVGHGNTMVAGCDGASCSQLE